MKTSRKEAFEAGETRYFTGKPCKHGHTAARYTQSGACSACLKISMGKFKTSKIKNSGLVTSREFRNLHAPQIETLLEILEAPLCGANVRNLNERAAVRALLTHHALGGSIADLLYRAAWGVPLPAGTRLQLPPDWGLDVRL